MKLVSTLFLLIALFCSTAFADGNQGSGGRVYTTDTKVEVKGGMTTEGGDPPPPCVPTPTETCEGNQGSGGRPAIMLFIQEYLISLFD